MRSAPPKGRDYLSPFAHPVELISSIPRDDFRMPVTGSGSRQPLQLPARSARILLCSRQPLELLFTAT